MSQSKTSQNPRLKILVADDHAMVRDGLVRLLSGEPDLEVVGQAGDGAAAVQMTRECEPDVLLLDVNMPKLRGPQVLEKLQGKTHAKAILLTATIDRPEMLAALEAGVRGLVMKHAPSDVLLKAIRCVAKGEYWVDREILAEWAQKRGTVAPTPQELTARERQIVREILSGAANRDIAQNFRLSEGTVKRHLSNIYTKLGVANRLELALYAMNHNIE
jgi:two-component system, NarL family, nitrate/nitrite response regulator NarL